MSPGFLLDLPLALVALGVALAMRPWRALGGKPPPGAWLLWWAFLPALWGADRYVHMPLALPLSGACMLMLMTGWPLAVLAFVPVALLTMALGDLDAAEALHRLVWLGIAPATLAMAIGALLRRWLPNHLFVYILGRGFFGTAVASALAGWLALALTGSAHGISGEDQALGLWLAAWGDAWLAGILVAIFVAFKPEWLATYADRIYLPGKPG
jgi:uncharacterized membrane protein